MNNFFQIITHGIITVIAIITLTISSVFNTQKPVVKSAIITTPPTPIGIELTPTPSATPILHSGTKTIIQVPSLVLSTNTPTPTIMTIQTYSILSLVQLVNMNGATAPAILAAQSAYNIFLQTPNLQYMTPSQQQQLFTPLLTTALQNSINQQKAQLQSELQQEQTVIYQPTPQPTQSTQNNNQMSQAIQACVNNKTASINSNPYLSESSRQAELANVYQTCVSQNQ